MEDRTLLKATSDPRNVLLISLVDSILAWLDRLFPRPVLAPVPVKVSNKNRRQR